MSEETRAAHVREVLDTCARSLQQATDYRYLIYATGLLLGVRTLLQTVEEWQRWGQCVAELLWERHCRDDAAAAAEPPAAVGEGGDEPHTGDL